MIFNISNEDRYNIKIVIDRFSQKKDLIDIFYDMCFCICAPQTTFKSNNKVIKELINRDFYNKDIEYNQLREIVKPVRFLRKADFLLYSKLIFYKIVEIVESNLSEHDKRLLLIKIVKGFGWKASSHFLRNCGAKDLAIIDTHIIKFMNFGKLPNSGKEYLLMEKEFRNLAKENKLSITELDAYIWKIHSNTDWSAFIY